ncbi:hypothetical protein B4N84_09470 [Flavobacterium sp. IR1]|nr:hypothetical protein B4N84_09470 [Flavobacterium sp. IR1]
MKKIYTIILLTFSSAFFGQTGMGTPTPRGALDINRPTTNTFGLVLPTNDDTNNMINPQGGTIAEGTVMYDSKMKCIKFFRNNAWSDCLLEALPPTPITADCSSLGFEGTFTDGVALSEAKFKVTITNNSMTSVGPIAFQATDLVLSGINGVTVSSVSTASHTFTPGESIILTFDLNGTPDSGGTLTGIFSKLTINCSASVVINKTLRFANFGTYSIGGSNYSAFNSQLQNSSYYGNSRSATYKGNFTGFSFVDITSLLTNFSAQQLIDRYDIISIQVNKLAVANIPKIKQYVDSGGVVFIICNSTSVAATDNIFKTFGGKGTIEAGNEKATTTTNGINKNLFGDATNITINGSGTTTGFKLSDLPTGAIVLAEDALHAKIFTMGTGGKAIFIWDEDLFITSPISGNIIDTAQEEALHNIMAHALRKAGF